jgi:hypothetical protein
LAGLHNLGEKASTSSYIQVIDEWIEIVDECKVLKQE